MFDCQKIVSRIVGDMMPVSSLYQLWWFSLSDIMILVLPCLTKLKMSISTYELSTVFWWKHWCWRFINMSDLS